MYSVDGYSLITAHTKIIEIITKYELHEQIC